MAAPVDIARTVSQPVNPPGNPYLADSAYPVAHYRANRTPVAGPTGPDRRLTPEDWTWIPTGPVNAYPPTYSGPYPDGRRVIWVSGNDRVAKLDADTLQLLAETRLENRDYYDESKVRQLVKSLDALDPLHEKSAIVDKYVDGIRAAWPHVGSAYKLLSRDNELFLPYRSPDGAMSLRVYGERDSSSASSAIEFRREWRVPPDISRARIFGQQLTSDGHLVMVTGEGAVIALSRDFSMVRTLQLPTLDGSRPAGDLFVSFVKNGLASDEQNGVYVVTRDYMHRVQWTGERLSIAEADGGWSARYPNENGRGSGSTPALMGWGPEEDHLVLITDGSGRNNAIAYWRDEIPPDWEGQPGYDRRVAGVIPLNVEGPDGEAMETENTPVVYGYEAFFVNTKPANPMPDQGSPTRQWMAENLFINMPGHEALGGTMIRWNNEARRFEQIWRARRNFAGTVCTVSDAVGLLYCMGARDGNWTLEGTDWLTGESRFVYRLGASVRFNPFGGPVIVAPNGDVDCACMGGFGLLRISPREPESKQ